MAKKRKVANKIFAGLDHAIIPDLFVKWDFYKKWKSGHKQWFQILKMINPYRSQYSNTSICFQSNRCNTKVKSGFHAVLHQQKSKVPNINTLKVLHLHLQADKGIGLYPRLCLTGTN